MQYVLAIVVVLLFGLFFFIGQFLLKDARKGELAARTQAAVTQRELEICRKQNP